MHNDGQTARLRLGDQHTVERIAMMTRQMFSADGIRWFDGDKFEIKSFKALRKLGELVIGRTQS